MGFFDAESVKSRLISDYGAISLNGSVDNSDTTSVQAVAYYRYFL
jgi:hypothetical protein